MAARSRRPAQNASRRGKSERRKRQSKSSDEASYVSDSESYLDSSDSKKDHERKDLTKSDKSIKSGERPKQKPKTKKALRKEGVKARKECKDLRQQIAERDETIGGLMDKIFELQPRSQALVIDGQLLQNQASDMQHMGRSWTIDYGIGGALPVLESPSQFDAVCKLIHSRAKTDFDGEKVTASPVGALIVLQAILAEFIDEQFFQRPYFFLSREVGCQGADIIEEGLKALEGLFPMGKDGSRIAILRAVVVQQLNPDVGNQQDSTRPRDMLGIMTADSKEDFYQAQARRFIEKWSELLVNPTSPTQGNYRQANLVKILRKAAHLALQFRTQCIGLEYCLPAKAPYNQTTYASNSDLIELHSSVNVSPGDLSLDGSQTQFVVEPLLVGIKSGEIELRRQRKVYGKAVVWLEPGSRSQKSNPSPKQTVIDLSTDDLEDTAIPRCARNENVIGASKSRLRRSISKDKIRPDEHQRQKRINSPSSDCTRERSNDTCSTEVMQKGGPGSLDNDTGSDVHRAERKALNADHEQVLRAQNNLQPKKLDRVEINNPNPRSLAKRKAKLVDDDKAKSERAQKRRGL